MQWSPHIKTLAVKASKVLNFIKRNLSNCFSETKASAYLSLVHPVMEYATCVWDPMKLLIFRHLRKYSDEQLDGHSQIMEGAVV